MADEFEFHWWDHVFNKAAKNIKIDENEKGDIKELSDDQLVEACGGLTAHKGGRHGLNMKAKLDRIAEAEREFLAKYGGGGSQEKSNDAQKMKKKRKLDEVVESLNVEIAPKKKRKKDKRPVNSDETPVTELAENTYEMK